jgi:hypothetical protein
MGMRVAKSRGTRGDLTSNGEPKNVRMITAGFLPVKRSAQAAIKYVVKSFSVIVIFGEMERVGGYRGIIRDYVP